MLELLLGIWIARATKGINPLVVAASLFVALATLAIAGVTMLAVWHCAPEAYRIVEWTGVDKYLPFLDLRVHDISSGDVRSFALELPSRMVLFSVTLVVFALALIVGIRLIGLALTGVVRVVRFARATGHA